jgi:hypothetical protein
MKAKFKTDPCLNNPCHHSQMCEKTLTGYKCSDSDAILNSSGRSLSNFTLPDRNLIIFNN